MIMEIIIIRLQVILGELDTATDPDCVQMPYGQICGDQTIRVGVESITVHPGFQGITGVNDIAILKLQKDVEFTGNGKHDNVKQF